MTETSIIGTICLFPYDFELKGWNFCDGRLMPTSQHPALTTLLGSKFGGDGIANFQLPNLNNNPNLPYGMKYQICIYGEFPKGNNS